MGSSVQRSVRVLSQQDVSSTGEHAGKDSGGMQGNTGVLRDPEAWMWLWSEEAAEGHHQAGNGITATSKQTARM